MSSAANPDTVEETTILGGRNQYFSQNHAFNAFNTESFRKNRKDVPILNTESVLWKAK